ncbi:MAG: hypothetical protein IKO72_08160 [Kiritimatiellae bacterium]|nr:hypothetical protein [Kiritimatiellia bacterium]
MPRPRWAVDSRTADGGVRGAPALPRRRNVCGRRRAAAVAGRPPYRGGSRGAAGGSRAAECSRSMRMFASLDDLQSASRSLVIPELRRLRAKREFGEAGKSVLGYAMEHPDGGKMRLEVCSMKDARSGKFCLFLTFEKVAGQGRTQGGAR